MAKIFKLFLMVLWLLPGCANPGNHLAENNVNSVPNLGQKEKQLNSLSAHPSTEAEPKIKTENSISEKRADTVIPGLFDTDKIRLSVDESAWVKIADEDGVQAYQEKNSVGDIVAFRGETVMPISIIRITTVLNDMLNRKDWVDSLVETRIVEVKSRFERTEYNHSKVPWPFKDRDFVYSVNLEVNSNPKTLLIKMKSVVHPKEPIYPNIVRGEVLHSFYYLQETSGTTPQTKLVIEMALDPKGVIPLWMVNLTQKKWPHNTILALKKSASRPDLVVPKGMEDYFIETKQKVLPRRRK